MVEVSILPTWSLIRYLITANTNFLNWLIVLGALGPGVRAEVYAYEPLEASGGGWTVVNMNVDQTEVVNV